MYHKSNIILFSPSLISSWVVDEAPFATDMAACLPNIQQLLERNFSERGTRHRRLARKIQIRSPRPLLLLKIVTNSQKEGEEQLLERDSTRSVTSLPLKSSWLCPVLTRRRRWGVSERERKRRYHGPDNGASFTPEKVSWDSSQRLWQACQWSVGFLLKIVWALYWICMMLTQHFTCEHL